MYRISELGLQVGLSRSTLLYYEKLGIIKGLRQENGYRIYTDADMQRLKLLQQLQAGGLTLKECQACLDAKLNRQDLQKRLETLDDEIAQKQKARSLLASLLGVGSMRDWHQSVEKAAPAAHMNWLMQQGFDEKQALRLKWLSKDMNKHEHYMADFEEIFFGLQRLGPGDNADSLRALSFVPKQGGRLLDIGCGKGVTTRLLAQHSDYSITALDNDEYALSCLQQSLSERNSLSEELMPHTVTTQCASMTDIPLNDAYDVVWSEGSAYIMGVENALSEWQRVIKPHGFLVMTDLVWLTDLPSEQVKDFWQQNYPDMTDIKTRCEQVKQLGYDLVSHFTLGEQAWRNYLGPLKGRVDTLKDVSWQSNAFADLTLELEIHKQYLGQYGYQFFILQKQG